jgi:hypothetical protein
MKTNRLTTIEMIAVLEQVKEMLPRAEFICHILKRIPIIKEREIKRYQFLGTSKLVKYCLKTGGTWNGICYGHNDILISAFLMPDHLRVEITNSEAYSKNAKAYIDWKIDVVEKAIEELKSKVK